jgi:DNA repair exonuclease SbcCD ATPase subunit
MLDLTDPAIHIDLFKEFYKDETIEKDIWSGLELLIQEKVKTAAHLDSSARNVKWSLLNMKFDNTFGYGKNNHINFDGMSGITGIFGRNARGKSSIIGTLLYTLFNTSDRGPIKNLHIVNTRKNYCRSSIDLKYKGDKYRVERQTVKHKGRKSIMTGTTHLNFFKLDENDEEIKDHSGEQRRETEKVVRNMLGEAEDFLLTSIASQGDINAFIKERATARKKVLTKFLGLTIFETMLENARKESNDLKIQLKNMPAREWQHVIAEKAKAKRESTAKIKELESDLEVLRKKEQTLIVSISKHNNSKIITPRDVERKELLLKETIEKANSIKLTKEAALEEKKKIEDEIRKIKAFIVSENYDELKVKLEKQASLEKEIVKLKHKIKIEEQTLNNQVKSAELLKEVPCGDKFLTCKFISESHKKSKLIDSQVEKINTLKENLSVLKTVFSGIEQEKIKEKIKEVESEKARLNLFETNVIRHERKEYEIGAKLKLIVEQIKREKEHLDEMKANVKQVDIDDALEKSKSLLEEIQASIKEKDSHRLAEAGIIGRAERDLEALKKERDRYMKIRKKWKVYEYFMKAISKTGIPLQITMSQLPIINSEIAKILQSVFSFTVEIEADDMSNAMDVYINYGDSRRIIEVGSGMEKMVASLAIRVALANISSLPKPDIFIIDEGFGVLDGVNVEAINRLLVSLKKWFKNILIITHIDSIKDVADNIIEITVNGHDSNVVYE